MSSDAARAFAHAAEQLAGTRFRLHGRSKTHGIDCVGVALAALAASGRTPARLPKYALRNMDFAPFDAAIRASGFTFATRDEAAGDLLVLAPSAGQFHLAIALEGGRIVHAHAGLRRVVIAAAPGPEQILRRYRLT